MGDINWVAIAAGIICFVFGHYRGWTDYDNEARRLIKTKGGERG